LNKTFPNCQLKLKLGRMRTKFPIARVIPPFLTGLHRKQEWQNGVTELRTDDAVLADIWGTNPY